MTTPQPSDEIREARRDLDGLPGYEALGDLWWEAADRCWVLHFRMRLEPEGGTDPTLDVTEWFALVPPDYPGGKIRIAPAEGNGITVTYPHQHLNVRSPDGRPWRTGDLCVATPYETFARAGYDLEPHDAASRLPWYIKRTRDWLLAARDGKLLADGDPFELPRYGTPDVKPHVVFEMAASTLGAWTSITPKSGFARLQRPRCNETLRLVRTFTDEHDRPVAGLRAGWGAAFDDGIRAEPEMLAAWVRLDALPVLPPWRAPATWGELRSTLEATGVDLLDTLRRLAPRLRCDRGFVLLLGAPIPDTVGAAPTLVHWLAIDVPALAKKPAAGFPADESGRWRRDLQETFASGGPIRWLHTANWAPDQIGTRGRAAEVLRQARVVVLGAGALGSIVCDFLVREGVTSLSVLDDDVLSAGNLTRHTLSVSELVQNKAVALAERLNRLNPHVRAEGFAVNFPGNSATEGVLQAADVIMDCTGSDEIVGQLARYPWRCARLFLSCALGLDGARLYVFSARAPSFPGAMFAEMINPGLRWERDHHSGTMPWEGTGCWHPVFPARASDVALFAATIPRILERLLEVPQDGPSLIVLGRRENEFGVTSVSPVALTPDTTDA